MKRTRRDVLRNASKLSAVLASVGVGATASVTAREYPEWDSETVYTGGDRVVYDGSVWEANWWTQGDEPDTGPGPWEELEEDDNDNENDNDADNGEYPPWDADTVYTGDDRVEHDGYVWEAQWWTQGDEPGESEWGPWEEIDVYDPGPSASFTVSDPSPEPGTEITLDASGSEGEIDSYAWNLGDGTETTGEVVTHGYDEEGDYRIELTVEDDDGETDSTGTTVYVGDVEPPTPDGVYTPYQGTWYDIVDGTLERDADRIIMSFIGDATRDGEITPGWLANCNVGSCEQEPLDDYADEIQTLQDDGIEVGLSIGGWESPVVARDADDPEELKDAYADLLDAFDATHLDIDDENATDSDRPDDLHEIRNEALALLKDERPEITVGFTVAATPDGIVDWGHSPGKVFIEDAVEKGLELDYVQPMTMHYDSEPENFETITSALEGTVEFLEEVYPERSEDELWGMVGVTPYLGEITTDIASDLVDFANERGMYSIAPWVLGEDDGGEFSAVFSEFESSDS
ncbi:PKD domain-containing protein [Natrarchaeobius halalkaliphilus]|uniref:PKD domain-containing protein n=1 Tax=Natrarchaeobius halalkaliphilus TaxID=1679091 RepID=A0A3N6NYX3_9EURY|nr:PKD domain-containing protein [Natrarchaeobius halalkaliphilus]RQG86676.1 PKD domain-containing protein [Natrarchaeobius halalkaliphilus]